MKSIRRHRFVIALVALLVPATTGVCAAACAWCETTAMADAAQTIAEGHHSIEAPEATPSSDAPACHEAIAGDGPTNVSGDVPGDVPGDARQDRDDRNAYASLRFEAGCCCASAEAVGADEMPVLDFGGGSLSLAPGARTDVAPRAEMGARRTHDLAARPPPRDLLSLHQTLLL